MDPGTVSVRVAFVLRSTEVYPAFFDLFFLVVFGLSCLGSYGVRICVPPGFTGDRVVLPTSRESCEFPLELEAVFAVGLLDTQGPNSRRSIS